MHKQSATKPEWDAENILTLAPRVVSLMSDEELLTFVGPRIIMMQAIEMKVQQYKENPKQFYEDWDSYMTDLDREGNV